MSVKYSVQQLANGLRQVKCFPKLRGITESKFEALTQIAQLYSGVEHSAENVFDIVLDALAGEGTYTDYEKTYYFWKTTHQSKPRFLSRFYRRLAVHLANFHIKSSRYFLRMRYQTQDQFMKVTLDRVAVLTENEVGDLILLYKDASNKPQTALLQEDRAYRDYISHHGAHCSDSDLYRFISHHFGVELVDNWGHVPHETDFTSVEQERSLQRGAIRWAINGFAKREVQNLLLGNRQTYVAESTHALRMLRIDANNFYVSSGPKTVFHRQDVRTLVILNAAELNALLPREFRIDLEGDKAQQIAMNTYIYAAESAVRQLDLR